MPAGSELDDMIGQTIDSIRRDHTLGPIAREAVKDIRATLMKFFFGDGDRGAEPGTPLNPLFHDLVAARKTQHAANAADPGGKGPTMDADQVTPSQVIENPQAYLPQEQIQDRAQDQAQDQAMAMDTPDRGMDAEAPTPSQVIDAPQPYLPPMGQDHGQERVHGHGR